MNSKLLIMAAGGILAACSATAANGSDSYRVTAPMPDDFEGQTVFLVNFDTGEKIDSAVVADGAAIFSGSVETPALARIIADGNRMGSFILEPGEITVERRQGAGTPLNDLYIAMQKRSESLAAQFRNAPADSTGDAERERILGLYENYADSVFRANADNPVGYAIFLDKSYDMSLPELEAALKAHPALKKYVRVNKLADSLRRKAATGPGSKFVDFTVTNDSTTQRFSDYVGKGKPVLVDFWASWCGPCIRETQVIKELLNEYGSKGLEVLGVAVWDEPQNTLRAISQHKLPWKQIINAQSVPTDLYGISGIPCIMLIAPDGTILSRDKQDDELRADVRAMMEGTLTPDSIAASQPKE